MAYKIRLKFNKYAHMIFIGHLDLMRYFQKAMRRAEVDISYSAGFSPHQIMSFAQPLGVGVYSNGEYVDISVESLTSSQQICEALNRVMAEGVDILSARLLPEDAKGAMASIAAASYTVTFREGAVPSFAAEDTLRSFYGQESILIEKETKKGSRSIDLKEHIYELSYDGEASAFSMVLDASSGGNIKPNLVMETLYHFAGARPGEFDLIVTREDIFTERTDEGGRQRFLSLEDVGKEY